MHPGKGRTLTLFLVAILLNACGGGGGGGGGGTPPGTGGTPPGPTGPTPPVAGEPIGQMTASSAGPMSATFLQFVEFTNLLMQEFRADVTSGIATGTTSVACDSGGTLTTTLSANRLTLTEDYSNCSLNNGGLPITIDGAMITEYSVAPSDAGFTVTRTFDGFEVQSGGITELSKGTFEFVAGVRQNLESSDRVTLDMSVESSLEGTVRFTDVVLDIDTDLDFLNGLAGISGASGEISHNAAGGFALAFNSAEKKIEFTGTGPEVVRLEMRSGRYYTAFHPSAADASTFMSRLGRDDLDDIILFDDSIRHGPIRRSSIILDDAELVSVDDTPFLGESLPFSLRDNFLDRDGDVLDIELTVTSIIAQPRSGPDVVWDVADAANEFRLEETEAGKFEFESNLNEEVVRYEILAHATDAGGLQTVDGLQFGFSVYRDFDLDGTADRFDNDDDNDGVLDSLDAFPLDPGESVDTDLDGTGDNADTDDDNDGVADVDDFYSLDPRCSEELDGNGNDCWFSVLSNNMDKIIDANGIVYIYDFDAFFFGRHTVQRFNSVTGHFLTSFDLSPISFGLDPTDAAQANYDIRFVEAHNALYVTYAAGIVTRLNLDDIAAGEALVHTLDTRGFYTGPALDQSPYAVIFDQYPLREITFYSYDLASSLVDTINLTGTNTVPFISLPESADICESGFALGRADGLFFQYTNTGGYNCEVFGEPVASPNGQEFLTFTGEIVDASLNLLAQMPFSGAAGSAWRWKWTDDGIYVSAANGPALYGRDGSLIATQEPPEEISPASSWTILEAGGSVAVVYRYSTGFRILSFGPP